MSNPKWHVRVAYRFKKKRGGFDVGSIIEAETDEDAEQIAIDRHITPYPSRVLAYTISERA